MRKTKNNQKIDAENPSMKKHDPHFTLRLQSSVSTLGAPTFRFFSTKYSIFAFVEAHSFYSILGSITARCKQALRFTAKLQHTHSKNITSDEFRLDLTEFVIFVVDSFELTFFSVEKRMNHSIEFRFQWKWQIAPNRSKSKLIVVFIFVCFSFVFLYTCIFCRCPLSGKGEAIFFLERNKQQNMSTLWMCFEHFEFQNSNAHDFVCVCDSEFFYINSSELFTISRWALSKFRSTVTK